MSSSLIWEPVVKQKENDLDDQLKFSLRKRYGDPVNLRFNHQDLGYLRGLSDCEVKGADELIEAIKKHGEVLVKEVW